TALEEAVRMLAAPTKVVRLHYSTADLSVARATLGLSTRHSEDAAVLMGLGSQKRVLTQPLGVLQRIVLHTLVATSASDQGEYTLALPTKAAVVFLAICEAYQAMHLHSMLQHVTPWEQYLPADMLIYLEQADREDFRWPLMFFSKVMPVNTAVKLTLDDIKAALPILMAKGLIEALPDVEDLGAFKLTENGWFIAENLRQQVGKAALGITALNADGNPGCAQMLFVRGAKYLIMCVINGDQAILGTVTPTRVIELVAQALMPADAPTLPEARQVSHKPAAPRAPMETARIKPTMRPDVKVPVAPQKPAVKAATPAATVKPGAHPVAPKPFVAPRPTPTPVTPKPVATPTPAATPKPAGHFCVTCGASLRPGARFCTGCGKPVA
ncbi:MAG: zinc-ribbon domain-containing protein, partial [Phycisphaerae bacterium]